MRKLLIAAVAVAALVAAGCSSGSTRTGGAASAGDRTTGDTAASSATASSDRAPSDTGATDDTSSSGTGADDTSSSGTGAGDLRRALLTESDVGAGYTRLKEQAGTQTTGSTPDMSSVDTTPECKQLLASFSAGNRGSTATTATALFTKGRSTVLAEVIARSKELADQLTTTKGALKTCNHFTFDEQGVTATADLAELPVPSVGQDAFGAQLTITATVAGRPVTEKVYLAEARRGDVLFAIVGVDLSSATGAGAPLDPSVLGTLLTRADAKVAAL